MLAPPPPVIGVDDLPAFVTYAHHHVPPKYPLLRRGQL
jgi:hypothetical protein